MLAFSGAGTVVRCGARALVGWDGCEVRLCDPCARVAPNVPCGFLAPPGVLPELGLALSHVRTRGFLLGPINDVQQ
jgi:hypothetical protein